MFGWRDGDAPDGVWSVEEHSITGRGEEADILFTAMPWIDGVLTLEFKMDAGGNSGVYFRVGDLASPVKTGIEAQILDSSGKKGKMTAHDHGGIIGTVGALKNMSKPPGEWNRMIVTCIGSHLQLELNGEKIVDIQLDQTTLKDRSRKGHIGLQDHGQPNDIKFRRIRIRELP